MASEPQTPHVSKYVPIAIDGGATESRIIRFTSAGARPEAWVFPAAGTYNISVLIWDSANDEPRTAESFFVKIMDDDLDMFDAQRTNKTTDTAWIYKDRLRKWKTGPFPR